jgi:signal transduction histidine kinase
MWRRLPIESTQPMLVFAWGRLGLALAGMVTLVALGLPYDGRALLVAGALGLPWSIGYLVLARRDPDAALSPLVPLGDLVILVVFSIAIPEAYAATRFAALFLIAAHAQFQGAQRGPAGALLASLALVIATAARGDTPAEGSTLVFFEVVFVLSATAIGIVAGVLRTSESASRLRARGLSRRTIHEESEVRRRVAESIHDGPVQDLIGLDMMLGSARKAASEGRSDEAAKLLDDAREVTERNIRALRDEIVDLGPYAFEELTFDVAIENCMPAWKRRYGFDVLASIEQVELPPEMAGDLFRITQEAVANAGRHADAEAVSISLRTVDSEIELRVTDNGHGFGGAAGPGSSEPGHLGLASMRERAEMLRGVLDVETSERGTRVLVRAPLSRRAP